MSLLGSDHSRVYTVLHLLFFVLFGCIGSCLVVRDYESTPTQNSGASLPHQLPEASLRQVHIAVITELSNLHILRLYMESLVFTRGGVSCIRKRAARIVIFASEVHAESLVTGL